MTDPILIGWHFLRSDGCLRDGSTPPPDGEWLEYSGPLAMCESGLHLSKRALDALNYAPGPIVCRVEGSGRVEHDTDKIVCSRRRILWRADATATLRLFARRRAQSVLHLWDPPEVVVRYLETGDESIRDAAWSASGAAWAALWATQAASRAAGAASWAAHDASWATQAAAWAAEAASSAALAATEAAWAAEAASSAAWPASLTAANQQLTDSLLDLLE